MMCGPHVKNIPLFHYTLYVLPANDNDHNADATEILKTFGFKNRHT